MTNVFFKLYLFSRISSKRELRENMHNVKVFTFTVFVYSSLLSVILISKALKRSMVIQMIKI